MADDDRIIGISRWESKEAFLAAVPPGFGVPQTTCRNGRPGRIRSFRS
jgi:hypothetical protein